MKLRVLLLLLPCALARAEEPPSRKAQRLAFEGNLRSVVQVQGPRRRGLGVVVGADGQVLTSVDYVSLEAAKVTLGEQEHEGKVVMANAQLKVALVAVEGASNFPAAPARPGAPPPKGAWLVAVTAGNGGALAPKVGWVKKGASPRSPFLQTDLSVPAGSPVFDGKGRLVGLCAESVAQGCRVLPLPALKAQLAQGEGAP